ncbi:MAG: histidine--tRNA ligase [Deltaproteobacteria bacterium]|nr:histidine--tRNA ligase [Deltaproteobacteria bacterium]
METYLGDPFPLEFSAIKGFKDILPEEVGTWQRVESEARKLFRSFGFLEISPPVIERTELFSRSIGEDTDIVSKEMYSFADSKGESLTLRPEATASIVRAYIQHRLYQGNPVQKLFTIGPMFRHERPQKGRFRQFHQIDAEILGDIGPLSDAEIVVLAMRLFEAVDLPGLSLHINSLGCPLCRVAFREELLKYLADRKDALCSDCRRRAETNPLRVFDCKVETCGEVVAGAPSILDFICADCRDHFQALQDHLKGLGLSFVLNPKLVRGLDYYTRTTFEIQTDRLGAQNAVLGGGRYDGLVRQLGGPDHPAIGFALGVERLVALLREGNREPVDVPDLFIAALGEPARKEAVRWLFGLRSAGLWIEMDYASKGLKAQMKRADRLGARKVLIVGDEELASAKAVLRDMETKKQEDIPLDRLIPSLLGMIPRQQA